MGKPFDRRFVLAGMSMLSAALTAGLTLSGCEEEGPAEKLGKEIDKTADEVAKAVEDAAQDVEDATKKKK